MEGSEENRNGICNDFLVVSDQDRIFSVHKEDKQDFELFLKFIEKKKNNHKTKENYEDIDKRIADKDEEIRKISNSLTDQINRYKILEKEVFLEKEKGITYKRERDKATTLLSLHEDFGNNEVFLLFLAIFDACEEEGIEINDYIRKKHDSIKYQEIIKEMKLKLEEFYLRFCEDQKRINNLKEVIDGYEKKQENNTKIYVQLAKSSKEIEEYKKKIRNQRNELKSKK